jgi:hypothetical protein
LKAFFPPVFICNFCIWVSHVYFSWGACSCLFLNLLLRFLFTYRKAKKMERFSNPDLTYFLLSKKVSVFLYLVQRLN